MFTAYDVTYSGHLVQVSYDAVSTSYDETRNNKEHRQSRTCDINATSDQSRWLAEACQILLLLTSLSSDQFERK